MASHNRNGTNIIDADSIGSMSVANKLKILCKDLVKSTSVITAGSTTYEVVKTFKYLGILTGPQKKRWEETMEATFERIKNVYGIIRFRKGIITYRTQQIFVTSLFRYYVLPYVLSGRISLATMAEAWTSPIYILELLTP